MPVSSAADGLRNAVEQTGRWNGEAVGDLHDCRDAKVARPALGSAELDRMQAGAVREVFLREALCLAIGADVRADVVPGLHSSECCDAQPIRSRTNSVSFSVGCGLSTARPRPPTAGGTRVPIRFIRRLLPVLLASVLVAAGTGSIASALDDHELAEQLECLHNALDMPIVDMLPLGHIRGRVAIAPLRVQEREVIDYSGDPAACQARGARNSRIRALIMDIHGRYVPFTRGGWVSVAQETNAEVNGTFTIPLLGPVVPPRLPNGRRMHCLPDVEVQVKNAGHYGEQHGSSSSAGYFGPIPGWPGSMLFADEQHTCTRVQLLKALRAAKRRRG